MRQYELPQKKIKKSHLLGFGVVTCSHERHPLYLGRVLAAADVQLHGCASRHQTLPGGRIGCIPGHITHCHTAAQRRTGAAASHVADGRAGLRVHDGHTVSRRWAAARFHAQADASALVAARTQSGENGGGTREVSLGAATLR